MLKFLLTKPTLYFASLIGLATNCFATEPDSFSLSINNPINLTALRIDPELSISTLYAFFLNTKQKTHSEIMHAEHCSLALVYYRNTAQFKISGLMLNKQVLRGNLVANNSPRPFYNFPIDSSHNLQLSCSDSAGQRIIDQDKIRAAFGEHLSLEMNAL